MNQYATAYMNYFDNELSIDFRKANSQFDAMVRRLENEGYQVPKHIKECDELREFAFDCDCQVEAEEVV